MALVTLKKRAYLLTVFLFGVLTFIGCGRSQQRAAQQSEAQRDLAARFNQLELKISAAKAEWRPNEPIVISVQLINNGRGHVIVIEGGVWMDYQISLVDGNDRPVPTDLSLNKQANRGAVSARPREIKPGETVENRISLSELFEMNRNGVYKMTVKRQVGVRGIVERELISNPIMISVVE